MPVSRGGEMIFKETWQQVLDGTKRQTRRPVKEGDRAWYPLSHVGGDEICAVTLGLPTCRTRWQVGNTYAVQPGRGKPAIWIPPEGAPIDDPLAEYVRKTESVRATWGPKVKEWLRSKGYREARIRITKIRRERLRDISWEDMRAEGVQKDLFDVSLTWRARFADLWDSLYRKPYRWEDNPEVWVLEFEKAEER